jgi:PAS domain S-box-containing protein
MGPQALEAGTRPEAGDLRMSLEDLAATPTGKIAPFARVAAALHASPDFLEKVPVAIYACDAQGRLLWFNARAAELWGRTPRIGDDAERFCGSYKLSIGGREISREETPMASVLKTGIAVYGVESGMERPDGSRISAMVHIEPVEDEDGALVGAIGCFHETTARPHASDELEVQAEELLRRHEARLAATHEEQAALHQLAERLQHAASLAEIYEAALDAILRALRCQRASILLFDRSGTTRFVAWRGLSPEYRRAVEGHSPWGPDTREPQPICLSDVAGSDLPRSLKHVVQAEGIAALAFIPLWENGRLLGKFMVYYDAPHAFPDAETDLGLTIARQLGFGVERMRAEQALRESETRKSAILQSALDGIITMDEEGRIVDFNPAAEQLLGHRRDQVLGAAVAETIIPERFRDAHRRGLDRFLRTGKGFAVGNRLEVAALRRDGSEFQAELAVSAARMENGHVLFTGYLRDVSERKRAEQAAVHLASIVESSDDAIVSKDLDGIITTWNRGAERLFGYTAEEAIGKPITLLIPPDRLDEEPRIIERIRRGERVDHYETVRRRKDGSLIDISLTVSPMRDRNGRIVGASKIARDITERKLAEARLRESERRLQDLLTAIPAAIYTTDAQGRITYYNQAAVDLAGRTPTLGSDEWCVTWKLYWPDGTPMPHDQCPMAVALREGRPIRNVEAVAERPDGVRIPFIPYPTPLRDESGNIVGAINMLVDVSERKQAETQQRILLNELNHRVKNNMQMLQSLLFSAARQTHNAEARKILAEASNRIATMAAAQRVLYGTTDATRFSAQEFIDAVCQTARQAFPPDTEIVCEAGSDQLPNDTAMPLALILNELLTNAVKHGTAGRPRVGIRVGLTRESDSFVLYVEDDGPGFDLDSVRRQSSGLQLVQGLARQLRGRFLVTRNPASRCIVKFSQGAAS